MCNGELDVQAERKRHTVVHDEVARILNSVSDLTTQIGSPDKDTQESTKYAIKLGILEVDVVILRTMIIWEMAELVGLVIYREYIISGTHSLVKVPPFLFIIWSKFPFVIFFSLGKGNTDSDDMRIVKKITSLMISWYSTEYVIDYCHDISDSSIILGFSEW